MQPIHINEDSYVLPDVKGLMYICMDSEQVHLQHYCLMVGDSWRCRLQEVLPERSGDLDKYFIS